MIGLLGFPRTFDRLTSPFTEDGDGDFDDSESDDKAFAAFLFFRFFFLYARRFREKPDM